MGEILPISRFSRKFINTYGSRESRFPYISTKGFLRRYSQSVESIFFFSFEMLVDSDEYILRSSSEEWVSFLKFSISCSYGSPPNFILWRVYICEHW